MKRLLKATTTTLALCAMTGQSWAADVCARPGEKLALKTAAMQQELMVAALYCNDIHPYNRFVISYRRELQDSDAALLSFFERARHGGEADYHSYKTALANNFSLESLHGMAAYCAAANEVFDAASDPRGSLRDFIASQSVMAANEYPACSENRDSEETVAGGSSAAYMRRASEGRN